MRPLGKSPCTTCRCHSGQLVAVLPEPGKDAFHRVPDFAHNDWDAVERVLTGSCVRGNHLGACKFAGSAGDTRYFTTTKQKKASNV